MPEGDAVWRAARRLHRSLAGGVLVTGELRWGRLGGVDLSGRRTTEVVPHGKHILHRLDDGSTVHSHLRMEGSWRARPTAEVKPLELRNRQIRAVFATQQWTCLGMRLGMLELIRTRDEPRVLGHLGPDILGADWDLDVAVANLRRDPARPVGAALLDQRNLAGIGTMYAAEALFVERMPPWRAVGEHTDEELEAIVTRAQTQMSGNLESRVPTTTGRLGRGEEMYAHARSGLPCRRCGDPVRVAMIGEPPQDRTMFYCPTCQGGLGPTDDGRYQRPLGR